MNNKPVAAPIEKTNIVWLLLIMVITVVMCATFANQAFSETDPAHNHINLIGIVKSVSWKREISIEESTDAVIEDWKYKIPTSIAPLSCAQIQSGTEIKKGTHLQLVCKQVYVRGGRFSGGHYKEECSYTMPEEYVPTYDTLCKYNGKVWKIVNTVSSLGIDQKPYWPPLKLTENQRAGYATSLYTIRFETNRGLKTFETTDGNLFAQCQIGSSWQLTIASKADKQNDKVLSVLPSSK